MMRWMLKVVWDAEHQCTVGNMESTIDDGPGMYYCMFFRSPRYFNADELDDLERTMRGYMGEYEDGGD